ncbi:MAG: hypothetical protein ACOYM3_28965 [Terrimicrobiaceae bacterium]
MKTKPCRKPDRLLGHVSARLDPALFDAMIRYAEASGYATPSALVRDALTKFLKKEGSAKPPARPRRRKKQK